METAMSGLSPKVKKLLGKKTFAHLATVMPDGSPQVSPVWVDIEGDTILVNSAEGRLKDKNVRRDQRVALSATDPENPYEAVMIRGRVVEVTKQGADEHIDRMAKKYIGKDKYPFSQPGEVRVLYRIEADKIAAMG
jgi:PPOX class probable F420-dependent enzyme